ncbi:unnamed protein product [Dovyalis caffra]|uniref:Uncharacterized protein n=1 Tax=Dovyalis caffra TaxID=77055 RepID=A0AAV1R4P9_9ROSI|nr:unnamed protein product [Dovyalis caffra]
MDPCDSLPERDGLLSRRAMVRKQKGIPEILQKVWLILIEIKKLNKGPNHDVVASKGEKMIRLIENRIKPN